MQFRKSRPDRKRVENVQIVFKDENKPIKKLVLDCGKRANLQVNKYQIAAHVRDIEYDAWLIHSDRKWFAGTCS